MSTILYYYKKNRKSRHKSITVLNNCEKKRTPERFSIDVGVPQGGILSPILYL